MQDEERYVEGAARRRCKSRAQIYLEQYRALCVQLDAIEACVADYRSRATRVTQSWQPDRVQSTPSPDARYDAVADAIDYMDAAMPDYCEILQRMQMQLREIVGVINMIPDATERSVIYAKYILFANSRYTFDDVADYVHYSYAHAYRILVAAHATVERILDGEISTEHVEDADRPMVTEREYRKLKMMFEPQDERK